MISVLVPSRNRPTLLRESLSSLGYGDFETLVYIDNDDPSRREYMEVPTTYTLVGKRHGYPGLQHYINELCKLATGDWLFLWNDDALMKTPDWWKKVHETDKPEVINFDANPLNNLFPLVSRQMYEAMEHFSLSPHNDSWVQDIANKLGIHTHVPGVEIYHRRMELNDKTKSETQAAYATTSPAYDGMWELRDKDAEKIMEVLWKLGFADLVNLVFRQH